MAKYPKVSILSQSINWCSIIQPHIYNMLNSVYGHAICRTEIICFLFTYSCIYYVHKLTVRLERERKGIYERNGCDEES